MQSGWGSISTYGASQQFEQNYANMAAGSSGGGGGGNVAGTIATIVDTVGSVVSIFKKQPTTQTLVNASPPAPSYLPAPAPTPTIIMSGGGGLDISPTTLILGAMALGGVALLTVALSKRRR